MEYWGFVYSVVTNYMHIVYVDAIYGQRELSASNNYQRRG
jgi:hypothetical protein